MTNYTKFQAASCLWLIAFLFFFPPDLSAQNCNCTYTIDTLTTYVDGSRLGLAPGSTVCMQAGRRTSLKLANFQGSATNYITFKNCGGQVIVQNTDFRYGISIENCKYFRLTGSGDPAFPYGIYIAGTGPNASGLGIAGLSSDFEVDHLEISNTGFAGIMGKADPRCDLSTNRGTFTQTNVRYHHNYIHDVTGEGIYVGSSFYNGINQNCSGISVKLYPHNITGLRIYDNLVVNSGWDGIQVGCAVADCEIYNNTITNYGTKGLPNDMSGIQINPGTTGKCYNNTIQFGAGHGVTMLGLGNNLTFNNLIINPGRNYFPADANKRVYGIFCDDRNTAPGSSFDFMNNTVISPKTDGIRIYSVQSLYTKVYNNIVINPGAFTLYGQHAYVYLSYGVRADVANNFYDRDTVAIKFANASAHDYRLQPVSPAVGKGKDVSVFGITFDRDGVLRPQGSSYDIGAYETKTTAGRTENQQVSQQFGIFPNPAQEIIRIEFEAPGGYHSGRITDLSGRILFAWQDNQHQVDVSALPAGIYLLSIQTQNQWLTKRLYKQ